MNVNKSFHQAVQEQVLLPFEYGVNDCALFCDTIYRKAFGVDLADGIRGTYNDKYSATRTLIRLGGLGDILCARGFITKHKNYVSPGDIVMCEGAAGIYLGGCKAVFATGITRTLAQLDETIYKKG